MATVASHSRADEILVEFADTIEAIRVLKEKMKEIPDKLANALNIEDDAEEIHIVNRNQSFRLYRLWNPNLDRPSFSNWRLEMHKNVVSVMTTTIEAPRKETKR